MKAIQINLNHCEAAQDLLLQMTKEQKADLVLISEPYRQRHDGRWCYSRCRKAAIWSCNNLSLQEVNDANNGYVRAKVGEFYFYSCYAPPSWNSMEYEGMLDLLVADAETRAPIVIGGDFNAWAEEWGSRRTNARGRMLLEALARLNVSIANQGSKETYRKNGTGSIIDVTFVSTALASKTAWWVSEDFTYSDHQAVVFQIKNRRLEKPLKGNGPKWNERGMDGETFDFVLNDLQPVTGSANEGALQLTSAVTLACDAAMARRKTGRQRASCHWWNEEIAVLRRECLKARRKVQRSRGRPNFHQLRTDFEEARRMLQKAIKHSKTRCFKKLCSEADINPWGTAYKIVMKKLKSQHPPEITCPEMLKKIVRTLFPQDTDTIPLPLNPVGTDREEVEPPTSGELMEIAKGIGDRKAPGIDGIPNGALKRAISTRPEIFVEVYQTCLEEGKFPRHWKKQRLVLLPKNKTPVDDPTAYRPICLLDTMGKILERIVYNRLLPILERKGALSDRQFGFRKKRSAIDAIKNVVDMAAEAIEGERWRWGSKEYCLVVTLDVKNAFNSAKWSFILQCLRRIGIPTYLYNIIADYLSDRFLVYESDEGTKTHKVTAGVPQGSVLGPLLWNTMYDGVLNIPVPEGCKIIGFADDIAVVIVAKHIPEIENTANDVIARAKSWLETAGLKLAEHKTEAVLISSRKTMEYAEIRVGSQIIHSKPVLKYLGMMIDNRLCYKPHIEYVTNKASKIMAALTRMLPNCAGPRTKSRLLLVKVVASVVLYAAPIWAEAALVKENRRKLLSVNRICALRAICGYRTISDEAAFVIAGMIPIDILANEMWRVFMRTTSQQSVRIDEIRKEEREASFAEWQARWSSSNKGRWTYRLIPNIMVWLNRSHGEVSYHLTQFLTGHGGYRQYLHRFGHDDSPICPACPEEAEDAEHVFFNCPRFTTRLEGPEPARTIEYMLQSEENWSDVTAVVKTVLEALRRIERSRREDQNRQ